MNICCLYHKYFHIEHNTRTILPASVGLASIRLVRLCAFITDMKNYHCSLLTLNIRLVHMFIAHKCVMNICISRTCESSVARRFAQFMMSGKAKSALRLLSSDCDGKMLPFNIDVMDSLTSQKTSQEPTTCFLRSCY